MTTVLPFLVSGRIFFAGLYGMVTSLNWRREDTAR